MERMRLNLDTKAANVAETPLTVSRIGLGTWAIGGWMWGGTDDQESVDTIRAAGTVAIPEDAMTLIFRMH